MKINLRRKPGRKSAPRPKKGSSGLPLAGVLRNIGSGFLKVSLYLAVLMAVSLTFVALYNYLLSSPYMKLERVEIHGIDESIRSDLLEMCGLTSEKGLLSIKLEALKKKMEKHPWVRTATVERKFPDTLIVQVEKEEPAMMVLMDKLYYMNRHGELFKPVLPTDEIDFPVLTGLTLNDPDKRATLNQAAHILEIVGREKDRWSLNHLSEIHHNENGGISIYFSHLSAAIRIPKGDLAGKMDALRQVTNHLKESGKINLVTQIDLNHADGAIVSFKKHQFPG